jgi:chemotaxis protein CheC
MNLAINELEKEILKEIVNIALAKAADAFAVIAKEQVLINAPNVQIVELEKVGSAVPEYEKCNIIIQSSITGSLTGKTFLLFSEEQADRFSEICLGTLQVTSDKSYNALRSSLLLEIGNIITGSLVTQLSNIFKVSLFGSVPELKNNVIGNVLANLSNEYPLYKPFIFTVKTQFVYSWRSVEMPFLLIFDLDAFGKVLSIIRTYIQNGKSILTT